MFLFFSLAVVKRQAELVMLARSGRAKPAGRGYAGDDLAMLSSMAASSGSMAVLVMALYINSSDVLALYPAPKALWCIG